MARKAKEKPEQTEQTQDEILHAKKRAFLAAYEQCGNITQASKAVGISRQTHYDWMRDDDDYKKAFADAEEAAGDALEAEARKRALAGSDTLLIFLLKGHKPEKYKERVAADLSGGLNNTTTDLTKMSPDERRARIDELNRKRGVGASPSA